LWLGRVARQQLDELIAGAAPLEGDFFRSVAFQYFHPDDVISGEGTRLNGGRFAPVGVKAVYASFEEETAMRESQRAQKGVRREEPNQCRGLPPNDIHPVGEDAPER